MGYGWVAEPQLASLNSCAVVVSFAVDLLSDGFKGMAFLLDWRAFTMSMLIALSTQSDTALSTYYDVSNKFWELIDLRTYHTTSHTNSKHSQIADSKSGPTGFARPNTCNPMKTTGNSWDH